MNAGNDENLKELFAGFVDAEKAEQATEEIRNAEQMFRRQPAPQPDSRLIADIKAKMAGVAERTKANAFRQTIYRVTAAAVVIIAAGVWLSLIENNGKPQEPGLVSAISAEVWESDNIAEDDVDLASLTMEIEELESELLAIQLGGENSNGYDNLAEIEMELIEINSDFWKG